MIKRQIVRYLTAWLLLCLVQGATVMAADGNEIHQEHFAEDYELKGLFSSCEMYFQTEDWNIKDASLKLFYTATMEIKEDVSDFTVSVNGEPVYSQKVPLTAGETQEISITIPKRLIQEGANHLKIESYIRTNDSEPCDEDISTAGWMVIRKDSYISLSYQPLAVCRNVVDVYGQLTSIEGLENKKSAVFLPGQATDQELTAAALILSGVSGNATLFYENLALVSVTSKKELEPYKYGIYVSEYDRLLPEVKELLTQEHKKAAQSQAVIAFVQPAPEQYLLVVTSKDVQALQNAGSLFGNPEYMQQAKNTFQLVSSAANVETITQKQTTDRLTQTGSYVNGPFRHTAQFSIPMESNKTIAAGSELELWFRYSQNLDFDRSLVTVFVGDTPIGSKKLEMDSCNKDVLKVTIPDNLQITGNFTINVTFDLEIKNLDCDIRKQDMPWAYVSNESSIFLNTKEISWLLFDYYPGPFIREGKMNQVMVVLPAETSSVDLETIKDILLTLGRFQTSNTGHLSVCRADNISNLSQANIISIGRFSKNPIVQKNNEKLYFRFSPKGTTITSNEKMRIEPNYGAGLGTAQLIYSPYSEEDYALLIVSGVTDKGMLAAAEYVGNVQKSWQIYGDGYVTDGELVFAHRFGPDNQKQNPQISDIAHQKDLLVFIIAGGSVILLLLISMIMVWKKHRRG